MFKSVFTLVLICVGCTTTPHRHLQPRVVEPVRSNFILSCVMRGQFPVTACLCFEEVIVAMKGTDSSNFNQLDMAVAQQRCMKVLQPILDKEMEEVMLKAAEEERKNQL